MRRPAASEVLDLSFLDEQTFGDRTLQLELLLLFEHQWQRLAPDLLAGNGLEARSRAAHTLRGSASAIGAGEIVRGAAALEEALAAGDEETGRALVTSLFDAAGRALLAIANLRRQSPPDDRRPGETPGDSRMFSRT